MRPGAATLLKGIVRGVDQAAMALLGPLRRRMLLLVRSERGMALPTALLATTISFTLASTAVVASVVSQRGTVRDSASKSAIAAADAGASVAMMRMNRYASSLTSADPCLGVNNGTLVLTGAAADGWCPEVQGTVGGSSYAYRVTPQVSGGTMSVVATGADGTVSRRVSTTFKETSIGGILSEAGVIAEGDITLNNSAQIRVGVGTNGNVTLSNSAQICGSIRHGVGKGVTFRNSSGQCSGYVQSEGNETLPAVSSFMPTDIATNNSNYRLAKCTKTTPEKLPLGCELDSYVSNNNGTWGWVPASRKIELSNTSTLTLGGGDYFICRLVINNSSHLIMAAESHVRIFFDTPENCGLSSGTAQVEINNSGSIEATAFGAKLGQYDVPGLYVQGSTTRATQVNFNNSGSESEFVLYAPNSSVNFNNSATYQGAVVGKTVTLNNSAIVKQPSGFTAPSIGGATIYSRQSYVECSGGTVPSGSQPNSDC